MANDGVVVVSDQTIGYTERLVHVAWDISPDSLTEREITLLKPYYSLMTSRNVAFVRIQYLYMTRWVSINYTPIPITERHIHIEYALRVTTERYIYYYPDTRERLCFVESLFTNTPLLLKYPKYFNWTYIPQILTPEFIIWSYYPLDLNSIIFKIVGSSGTIITLNSGVHPDKFRITRPNGTPIEPIMSNNLEFTPNTDDNLPELNALNRPSFLMNFDPDQLALPTSPESAADKQYKITVLVDHIFDNDEVVNCYITASDIKGQPLLPGLW